MRPPAIPLIVHNPTLSTWAVADTLNGDWTRHWTGLGRGMSLFLRTADGRVRYLLGDHRAGGAKLEAMPQTGVEVLPTRTLVRFADAELEAELEFCAPMLPDSLDLLAWPMNYLALRVRSRDGQPRALRAAFDLSAEWTVDRHADAVTGGRHRLAGLEVLRCGSAEQRTLARAGDDLRGEWGWLYLSAPTQEGLTAAFAGADTTHRAFIERGEAPADDLLDLPCPARPAYPTMSLTWDLGEVGGAWCERHATVAFDEVWSAEYFHRRVRPWWRRVPGAAPERLLHEAEERRSDLLRRCAAFDRELMEACRAAGGNDYAGLCALSYRQCLAAHTLCADSDGTPLHFSKENFSNGSIATVDVTYPGAPFFLLFRPELLRAQLEPVLRYASTPQWPQPFAPHDLGTYPLANGQTYCAPDSLENQMPVEECGNMLILCASLARLGGDLELARAHWPLLGRWAAYLLDKGLDPDNQLCTDDFAGHLAHNCNLAVKAVIGLGAYAQLAAALGHAEVARSHRAAAEAMAQRWEAMADDGDHYRLTFDGPGTWSQKYNLVWDGLLGLDLFPSEVARREVAFYLAHQDRYGVPLDSRKPWTKIDWTVWSATLAERDSDFRALVAPLARWADETPTRVPLCDWHWTDSGKQSAFQARSVVGGIFIKLLKARGGRRWGA